MSNKKTIQSLLDSILGIFCLAISLFPSSAAASNAERCNAAAWLDAQTIMRDTSALDELEYRIEIPGPGLFAVEVTAPGAPGVGSVLSLSSCDGSQGNILQSSPTHQILALTEPGSFLVRVVAPDPGQTPLLRKLLTRFLATDVEHLEHASSGTSLQAVETTFRAPSLTPVRVLHLVDAAGLPLRTVMLPVVPESSTKEEELHEVDPDPFAREEELHEVDPDPHAREEELHEVDPDPTAKEEELHEVDPDPAAKEEELHEVDPDPLWICSGDQDLLSTLLASEGADTALDLSASCTDDDTFACATTVEPGRPITARLDNGWGDDEDVYRFRIATTGAVRVVSAGAPHLTMALYDGRGQHLTVAQDEILLSILQRGEYFLRISGGSSEKYRFLIEEIR